MLSENNIRSYLKHVLVNQSPEVSISFIKQLQNAHLATFPFSNLGVLLHENLSLESQVLFERVVTNKRGGYCFEHNKIFFEILKNLGFQCDIALGRVLHNRDIDVPRTHRITKVTFEECNYIVDVGFGPLCPRVPLNLDCDKPQDQGDAVYRIIQPDRGRFFLQIEQVDGWFTLYSFDNGLYTEADCLCGHHYSSTHADATFVNNLVVSLKSYHDVRLLKNGEFHRIRGGNTVITKISSQDNLTMILVEEFGFNLISDQLSELYEGYCR
ncbi:arylamine N-acetyltransferase family protein [Desulfocastanea catecholica]